MAKILTKNSYIKSTAIVLVNCFLFSFVFGNSAAEVIAAVKTQEINNSALPYSYGKITRANITDSKRAVIQIQDLHCHPQVQKNIANIIELIDKNVSGGINSVYLEGAFGNVDTSWLKSSGSDLDKILLTGYLTGAEYYSALSGKNNLIKGLENEKEYIDNLKRFGGIAGNQNEINAILHGIDESTKDLKSKYYNPKQIKIERLYDKYAKNKISARKYYALLSKYLKQMGIDINKYENTGVYISLLSQESGLKYKEIQKELQRFVRSLKDTLPYSAFRVISENNVNEKLYDYLINVSKEYNINLSAGYPELNKFFNHIQTAQRINPIELINEEESLRNEINSRFSNTTAQTEVIFLMGFQRYLKDFLTSKITSKDYAYYKANVNEYKKLWVKYVDNRVLSMLDGYMADAEKFYAVNIDRNAYFVNALSIQKEKAGLAYTDGITLAQALNSFTNKQVDVVITGGFHTEGVSQILKDNNISYIVITPNVSGRIKEAEESYLKIMSAQNAAFTDIETSALAYMAISLSPQIQDKVITAIANGQDLTAIDFGKMSPSETDVKIRRINALVKGAMILESDERGSLPEALMETINSRLPAGKEITPETFEKYPELISALVKAIENNDNVESAFDATNAKNIFKKQYIILAGKIKDLLKMSDEANVKKLSDKLNDVVNIFDDNKNKGVIGTKNVEAALKTFLNAVIEYDDNLISDAASIETINSKLSDIVSGVLKQNGSKRINPEKTIAYIADNGNKTLVFTIDDKTYFVEIIAGFANTEILNSELKRYIGYATEEARLGIEECLNEHLNKSNKTKFTKDDLAAIDNFYNADFDESGVTINVKTGSEIIKFRYDYESKKVLFVFNSSNFVISSEYFSVLEKLQLSAEKAGFEIYAAGGLVRDSLLGIQPNDLDLYVRNINGELRSDLRPLYEQLQKDFPKLLENLKATEFNGRIASINFFIDGKEVALIKFNGFRSESRRDATINAFFYNHKTNDIIDVTNKGFYDFINKKITAPDINGKEAYLNMLGSPSPSYKLHKLIRYIRVSFRTGFELSDEIKEILADKKVIRQFVEGHLDGKNVKELSIIDLLSLFRVEDTAAVLKYLHEKGLLSAIIPEIKGVSRKKMNYMLNNISKSSKHNNDKFAALLTVFGRETALKILNNFPKTLHGFIDKDTFGNNDINEIMEKYDAIISSQTNIFTRIKLLLKRLITGKEIEVVISESKPKGAKFLSLTDADGDKLGTAYKKGNLITVYSKDMKLSVNDVSDALQQMIYEGRKELEGVELITKGNKITLVKPSEKFNVSDLNVDSELKIQSISALLSAA